MDLQLLPAWEPQRNDIVPGEDPNRIITAGGRLRILVHLRPPIGEIQDDVLLDAGGRINPLLGRAILLEGAL